VDLLAGAVSGKPSAGDTELQTFELREAALAASSVDDFELREAARSRMVAYGLSEREAQVAYLHFELEWRHGPIAQRLGIAVSTSRELLTRARRKMQRAM
jgi:DNA-directed RNA polymerase specialized sigma24 family protein